MEIASLVKETTTTTGTGTLTLAGAVIGFRTFAASVSASAWVPYFILSEDGTEFERGVGQLSSSTTLTRWALLESSNSGYAVDFPAGTHTVGIFTQPSLIGDDRGIRLVGSSGTSVFSIASGASGDAKWNTRSYNTDNMYPTLGGTSINIPDWADVFEVSYRERFRYATGGSVPAGAIYSQFHGTNINLNSQYSGASFGSVDSGGYYLASMNFSLIVRRSSASAATISLRHYNHTDQTIQRYEGFLEVTILG